MLLRCSLASELASLTQQGLRYAGPPGYWLQGLYLEPQLPCHRFNAALRSLDHSSIPNGRNAIYNSVCWQYSPPLATGTEASRPLSILSNRAVTCLSYRKSCSRGVRLLCAWYIYSAAYVFLWYVPFFGLFRSLVFVVAFVSLVYRSL